MSVSPEDAVIHRQVLSFCGITGRVIDYGCGRGSWLPALSERCETVTAIDRLQFMADDAAALNLPNVRVLVDDSFDQVETGSTDAIVSITTLQIFETGAEWHLFFAGARRVLKPGGLAVFHVPTYRLGRDYFMKLEGLRSIKVNGWRWGLERQLGWLLIWMRALWRTSIEATPRYYAVRPEVVEALIASNGFEIIRSPQDFLDHTDVAELSGIPSPDKTHPRYSWWLIRKPERTI